jgi:protein-S-isoprenylcysteine O-methyltransferase Ste14
MSHPKAVAWLTNPYVDKLFAVVAILPTVSSVYVFVLQALAGQFDLFSFGIAFWGVFTIVPMLTRRTATRVSVKPFDWFITAGRTYWILLMYYLIDRPHSVELLPTSSTEILFWISIFVVLFARIDLGRNIGFVPARRDLVTTGMYGWVRHPIHTGQLLFYIAFFIEFFSPWNATLIGIGIVFVIAKTIVEENFLKSDEDYQAYCRQVPWRWIPWVA